jgi:hypothetical protein
MIFFYERKIFHCKRKGFVTKFNGILVQFVATYFCVFTIGVIRRIVLLVNLVLRKSLTVIMKILMRADTHVSFSVPAEEPKAKCTNSQAKR